MKSADKIRPRKIGHWSPIGEQNLEG